MSFFDRIKKGWNAFREEDDYYEPSIDEHSSSTKPDIFRFTRGNERSIITTIYNRIAMDCASIAIKHVDTDANGRYTEDRKSSLNYCLTVSTNVDQTPRAFVQDVVMSLLDEGVVAIIPTDTDIDPMNDEPFSIKTMRVGEILEWYPERIKVRVYNERTGLKQDIFYRKDACCIIENPLYAITNEPNSTMQRLIRKLNLLDAVDEQSSAGKLDLIIQLPYIVKTDAKKAQAEQRRKDIEEQLRGSKYGIAYTDGTEKITQLNRPIENNLMKQIEYLTSMLYSQLGLTQEILDGSASDTTMLNYNNRTIEPIMSAIVDEMRRKFLTDTARTQGQTIMFFRDPFRLVPVSQMAEIADKFTRNEIMSSNEIRQIVGLKPSEDPRADELRNKNLNESNEELANEPSQEQMEERYYEQEDY